MLQLYSLTGRPYCAKVERKLDSLGLSYERHDVPSLRSSRSAVEAVSGQTGVPVLVDPENGVDGLAESADIVSYLERTYGWVRETNRPGPNDRQTTMTTKTGTRRDAEHDQEERRSIGEETLRAFPPSAKLVLTVLEFEGPLTQKELATETRLPRRAVRQATSRLEETGMIERRVYVPDARQSRYALTAGFP